jgi:flagellar biosynthesis GTPase FlhF
MPNPRAVPGSNQAPDYAQQVTDRIAAEYAALTASISALLDEAREMPTVVDDDETALKLGALIKRMRDADSRTEGIRVMEGEPYLRGGNAVNAFFFGWRDKLGKRNKNDRAAKAGAVDILQARVNDYQNRKIAEENARLAAERRVAEALAEAAHRKAEQEAQEAREAELKASRARSAASTAATKAAAEAAQRAADTAAQEAARLRNEAEEARMAALAKPADIARVRGNDQSGAGVTLTVAQEPYAILTDRSKVDMNLLRPYFTEAEIEKALRGWAKSLGHKVKMDGAEIGFRNKGVTR